MVGSIFKSLSILKYRNKVALELLIEWMKSYKSSCRNQDISCAIMALAVLNFKPVTAVNLIEVNYLLLMHKLISSGMICGRVNNAIVKFSSIQWIANPLEIPL